MLRDDYNLEFIMSDDGEPKNAYEKAMYEIIDMVKYRLTLALRNRETGLTTVHPQFIICSVVTNILVGLLDASISNKSSVSERLKMVKETLEEISVMTIGLWHSLEAQEANDKVAH